MKNSFEWKKGTIEHPLMPEGGRGLEDYEKSLGFRRQELEGLRVLDLGCGPEIKLARELKASKIDTYVVSLSPDFSIDAHRSLAKPLAQEYDMVAGIGQNLPLRDERFDRVLCLNTYDHLPSKRAFVEMVTEIVRIMKDGGIALLAPFETFLDRENERSNTGVNPAYEYLMKSPEINELLKDGDVRIYQEEIEGTGLRMITDPESLRKFRAPINRIIVEKGRDDEYDSQNFWDYLKKLKKYCFEKKRR